MTGRVSLVGAGPGDPGLLTIKALRRIRSADLIVYDTLANPDHLRHAKPEAVKVCVGKGFRHKKVSQEKINRWILRAARRGQNVVRLKGGDPYLFGRGGEEALHLFRHRVPFEVVPGVTSATACAAYAGIPLTHRDHNASVTFLTGHRAGDGNLDTIDWRKIASLNGTIVIYMGFYNLAKIARHLVEAGMPASTPVAVIEWGTLPRQKSCAAPLGRIGRVVQAKKLKAPCIIIIGDVVRLGGQLGWFERLPLFGKTVVVTRASGKAGMLREKLWDLGAEAIELPLIEIKKLSGFTAMDRAIRHLSAFDWIVFTSAYGVDFFFDRLETHHRKDARSLAGVRIAVVGPETAAALKRRGVAPDLKPKRFETRELAAEFRRRRIPLAGKKVLLCRTNLALEALERDLKKIGAIPMRLTAYRTVFPRLGADPAKRRLEKGRVDFVTFTSSSTVHHFVRLFGKRGIKKIARKTRLVSIGPVTSETMRSYGLRPAGQAKIFTTDGLVEALKRAR